LAKDEDVDARDKRGHDELRSAPPQFSADVAASCAARHAGGVMISRTRYSRAVLLLAAGFAVASALPARAQSVVGGEKPDMPAAEAAADANDPDLKDLDWSQLNVDASTLATAPGSKARLAPRPGGSEMSWSAKDKSNGAAAVSVKQPVSPFWDTRIGADMTVTRQPSTMSELLSERATNGGAEPQSSGTAWAAVTAPGVGAIWDKTAVEARVDPTQDQSKLGTSLSKSLPLNEQYSLTLQNGYNVIQQGHSGLPCADCVNLSAMPAPGIVARPARNYGTDQSAKLSIAETGTSFVAGQTLSTTDDKWLRKVGAEQKLFDGVSISASVGETPQGITNRSLSAGFKRSW
jgi:hypothetical protein